MGERLLRGACMTQKQLHHQNTALKPAMTQKSYHLGTLGTACGQLHSPRKSPLRSRWVVSP